MLHIVGHLSLSGTTPVGDVILHGFLPAKLYTKTRTMTKTHSSKLTLVEPTDPILNRAADEITTEEVASPQVQDIIGRMLKLSAGKGHSEKDHNLKGS